MIWTTLRPGPSDPTVISHLHPMILLVALLAVLVVADRRRWLSPTSWPSAAWSCPAWS
jgi:hypothetical protein